MLRTAFSTKSLFALLLVSLILVCSLVNAKIFDPSSMAAYFFWMLSTCVLLAGACCFIVKEPELSLPLIPFSLLIALASYVFLHGSFMNEGLNTRHTYIIINSVLIICLNVLFNRKYLVADKVYLVIAIVAVIESVICFMQYAGLMAAESKYFPVTGTWVNPNVTAMFMAMAIPAILKLFFSNTAILKRFSIAAVALVLLAILLIKCRSAMVAVSIVFFLFLNSRFYWLHRIRKHFSKITVAVIIAITTVLVAVSGIYLYKIKQASADGRRLIWKISLHMIAEKPLLGYGYGNFERAYNLSQAKYFSRGAGTDAEARNASFVHMAYNELLETWVEGGLVGIGLCVAFIVFLLIQIPKQHQTQPNGQKTVKPDRIENTSDDYGSPMAAYCGIVAFIVMSVFNFTVQAVPVLFLFSIYAGIQLATFSHTRLLQIAPGLISRFIVLPALLLFIIYTFYTQCLLAKGYIDNRNAKMLAQNGSYTAALELLKNNHVLKQSSGYWLNYGNVLVANKQYSEALEKFSEARLLTADPELYLKMGKTYYATGDLNNARQAFEISRNICPSLLSPKYALMNLYVSRKDTVSALAMAYELMAVIPKGSTEKSERYKREAMELINRLKN